MSFTNYVLPSDAPPWMPVGWKEIGTHELPENRGPAIRRYITGGKCGTEGDPWCAIFENFMLESCGLPGTRSPSSQSFRHHPEFVQLDGPAYGAIVVFWRGSPHTGLGHVGNYVGERGRFIATLGGNENDQVEIELLARDASTFGLVGFFWPKRFALPLIKPVIVAANAPAKQVTVT